MSPAPLKDYLQALNPAQLSAATHNPTVPLQILAGPGSGKTKVLTSRIAHLILDHGIPPSSICAVTFTNKAANEMKERLKKLIGKDRTSELRMGTFHALCALLLRKHSHVVGIETNFTICDAEESKKVITPLLKQYRPTLEAKDIVLKEGTVLSMISRAKAKGLSASDLLEETIAKLSKSKSSNLAEPAHDIEYIVAEIYQDYEKALRKSNSLDFDDLLLFGVQLLMQHKHAVNWCKHVLVDEFQDTNITQYELMRLLAVTKCVTIVGDPDQSIYGWRSAEVGNLKKMQHDFPSTIQIFLEQNYRSTGSILDASLAIVAQDKTRIPKSLRTAHPPGTTPVMIKLDSEYSEASFIATEIKRLVAHSGGMLGWGDFVVLLRFNALSRAIESALQKEGIPNRILGGHKFFERMEIKDLLAYLQLVDNASYYPSFARAVNVPSRGIGEKTLGELVARGDKANVPVLTIVEKIHDGRTPDIKPAVKRKLVSFVTTIRKLRVMAVEGSPPADLIRRLLDLIGYEQHLQKTEPDWETRWENVQELITFASDVNTAPPDPTNSDSPAPLKDTPLRLFLQASMLSSEGANTDGQDNNNKVTISTCHAAKGLEWPVVIVPAVEQGTFPFYRTDDVEEERRLLYVACTRAQSLLYLTHVAQRKVGGVVKAKEPSVFMTAVQKDNATLFTEVLSDLPRHELGVIATVLERSEPDQREVQRRVQEFNTKQAVQQPQFSKNLHPREFNSVRDTPMPAFTGPAVFVSSKTFNHPGPARVPSSSSSSFGSDPSGWGASTSALTEPDDDAVVAQSTPRQPLGPSLSAPGIDLKIIGPGNGLAPQPIKTSSNIQCVVKPLSLTRNSVVVPRPRPVIVPSSTANIPGAGVSADLQPHTTQVVGVKRRLGMGRGGTGYTNKRFKPPV